MTSKCAKAGFMLGILLPFASLIPAGRCADSAPLITSPATNRTVLQDGPTTFAVEVSGSLPLTFQWFRDGQSISGATNQSLTLNSVQPADEGGYWLAVTNGFGDTTSQVASLAVDPGTLVYATNLLVDVASAQWRYNQSGADLGSSWKETNFNDSAWSSGTALFGLETTPAIYPEPFRTTFALGPVTYYLRTRFNFTGIPAGVTLVSSNLLDDGMVCYLNGSEAGRLRLNGTVTAATLADNQPTEGAYEVLNLSAASLAPGTNVLAVEVHQTTATSTDVAFGMSLLALNATRTPDAISPALLSASAEGSNRVVLVFSERIDPATATNKNNYALDAGLAIFSAAFTNDPQTIVLLTGTMTNLGTYTVTLNNLKDRAVVQNTIVPNTQRSFTAGQTALVATDVGTPVPAGNTVVLPGGGYDITAGGSDIGGTSDQFAFSYQTISGNFDLRVRVEGLTRADTWSKAGLLARGSLDANSAFAGILTTPSAAGVLFESRSTAATAATAQGTFPVNFPATWLRLQRAGNVFTGHASYDGQSWMQLGSATITLPGSVFVGMAVSSHQTGVPATANFRDYSTALSPTAMTSVPREPLGPSSRKTPFAITEIMYKPAPRADTNSLEFVEIYNSNPFFEDLSGFRLAGDIDYVFPTNTVLQGGQFMVVAKDPTLLRNTYGLTNVLGPYTNSLKTSGRVRLRSNLDAILLEVNYAEATPWPAGADGSGHSIVLARPSYGEDYPEAWALSDQVGGSPGGVDGYTGGALRNVMINEFLAHTDDPQVDFIELYNHANQPVNVSGCTLADDPWTNKFVLPANTIIPARGFIAFNQTQLGFSLDAAGETIYFKDAAHRVIDAVSFKAQANGVSSGRYPNGANEFYPLQTPTAGAANSGIRLDDIVISEIMYKPVSDDGDDEYVELFNQGTNTVSLSGWRLADGVSFTFPSNAVVAPGGYVVVGRSVTNLLARYTQLNLNNTFGNFSGTLGNKGDRIALTKPDWLIRTNATNALLLETNLIHIAVDEVTYRNGGQWGTWANGGGSSLELVNSRSNHRLAANWADSDESAKAPWTTITATGLMDLGQGTANFIELLSLDTGEYLVDDVEVMQGTSGSNLVPNPGFNSGLTSWTLRGNHVRSSLENTGGFGGGPCLHVRASYRGDYGANRIRSSLTATPSGTVTLRAKVRWLAGWPEFLLRLHGNYFEATGPVQVPSNLGTPGLPNSRAKSNVPPAIHEVAHSPVVPAAGQAVVVTARAHDVDGLSSLALKYRVDPAASYASVPMVDNGTGGDAVADDGVYSATIPGQAASALVAFLVTATDSSPTPVASLFPTNTPVNALMRECLVRFGDPAISSSFGIYRQWFTQAGINAWINRPVLSNERIEGTFIYGNFRAIYTFSSRYAGSPYHQGFTSPLASCHYSMEMPLDDLVLGTENFNKVHGPGNGAFDDNTRQREQTGYWMARQLKLPWLYRRFVNMFVNGTQMGGTTSGLMEDMQVPGADYLGSYFPDDPDGNLYKLQPWFEMDDAATGSMPFVNQSWCTLNRYTTTINGVPNQHKLARYRWNYLSRAIQGTASDYTNVTALVDAANTPTNPPASSALASSMESMVDMDAMMRTFAIERACGNWDSVGANNEQNMYGYFPTASLYRLIIFDFNIILGNSGSWGPGPENLFTWNQQSFPGAPNGNPPLGNLYGTPKFRRMYLRGFKEIAAGPMNNAYVDPVMDAKYAAFLANGLTGITSPSAAVKVWISTMRTSLQTALNNEGAGTNINFALGVPNNLVTSNNLVTLTGVAPLELDSIRINGVVYPIAWTTVRNWLVQLAVTSPSNTFVLQGYDRLGNALTNAPLTASVQFNGPVVAPEDAIVMSEIMYRPVVAGASYVELFNRSTNFSFDLSGWRLNGLDYTFPQGSILTNKQYLVLGENRSALIQAFGASNVTFAEFGGNLDPDGETLTLERPVSGGGYSAVNRVRFENNVPWPPAANGTGPSLQLLDTVQENARVSNWSDGSGWRYFSQSGTNTGGFNKRVMLWLDTAGVLNIDDMFLALGPVAEVGSNYISNGDFELPLAPYWNTNGSYAANSTISTAVKRTGNSSMELIFTNAGGTLQYLYYDLTNALTTNFVVTNYTLSFWYLPTTNASKLTARLGTGLYPTFSVRSVFGTPGAPSSRTAVLPPYPALWVNEVQPVNLDGIMDNAGEREPWLELFNAGTNALSLAGFYLGNSYTTNLTAWAFPSNAVIAPRQFKIIWADGQPEQGTLTDWHASFRLNSTTGQVALVRLVDSKPQIVDYLTYGNIGANLSYGDFPDGQPFFQYVLYTPTPGATNVARPFDVLINEWMAANTNFLINPANGRYDDWFELFNAGTNAVNLEGFYLSDNPGQKTKFRVPAGYTIPPRGFLFVWADNEPQHNSTNSPALHVNFQLSRNGDDIGLYAPDGSTVVDQIAFGAQTNNISEGRYADGAPAMFFMTMPTPGQPNIYGSGNQPPVLGALTNRVITLGQTLSFVATATDPGAPPQTLTFSLDPLYPAGASINAASGAFTWTPSPAQAPGTNAITVRVTDDGSPPMSDARAFTVIVRLPPHIGITMDTGNIWLRFATIPGHHYRVVIKDDLNAAQWTPMGPDILATGNELVVLNNIGSNPQRFYQVMQVD